MKGIQVSSNEGPCPFLRGDNYKVAKLHWWNLEIFLSLQNYWANFYQTWHNAFLGEVDSSLFKWRVLPFSKGRWLWNSENALLKFKILILQNDYWANYQKEAHGPLVDNYSLNPIISKLGVLLVKHNFSELKNLANNAKNKSLLKFQLIRYINGIFYKD